MSMKVNEGQWSATNTLLIEKYFTKGAKSFSTAAEKEMFFATIFITTIPIWRSVTVTFDWFADSLYLD